ncbi:MAG: hypothetical protein N3J91_12640 [Verrucomicrobiae bacterium]|nr:hypothetical protein [Verrucomicrobiae bacterium]
MKKRCASELDCRIFRTGSLCETPPPMELVAGPLRLLFEIESGFLRRVCLGRRELLRGIYAAVRDENWRTIPPQILDFQPEVYADHFLLKFHCEHREGGIDFRWDGQVEGHSDGTIIYTLDGRAHATFRKNRIGFCVLHPIRECAGARTRQVRVGGEVIEGRFPSLIEPQIFGQSPLRDLCALAHEVQPGLWAELKFAGDLFEMEDQRNWTDASFKTYCTPLALPFPVLVKAGTRIQQRVELRLKGAKGRMPSARPTSRRTIVHLRLPGNASKWRPLPLLGLGMATHEEPLCEQEAAWLRALPLAHLRCDLPLSQPHWPALWRRAVRQARRLNLPLELALHLPSDLQAIPDTLARTLAASGVALARVAVLREGEAATSLVTLERVRRLLGRWLDSVPVGAGTNAHFCELNREQALGRVPWQEADFLFWPITPQVHAFDDVSLVETLEVQGDTLAKAAAFAPGKPCVISPVTLKPRFNAVATTAVASAARPDSLPENVDPRQSSLLAAGWTLGSLATLSVNGVSAFTYYETTGWRGVMETRSGSPSELGFHSVPGGVYPVYFVLAALDGFNEFAAPSTSGADQITTLALRDRLGRRRFVVANVRASRRKIQLHLPHGAWAVRTLHEENYLRYACHPEQFIREAGEVRHAVSSKLQLELGPCALAVVDELSDFPNQTVRGQRRPKHQPVCSTDSSP